MQFSAFLSIAILGVSSVNAAVSLNPYLVLKFAANLGVYADYLGLVHDCWQP